MIEAPYSVRLWPDGKCDLTGYRKVYARSLKEAAEKLYGGPLSEIGSMSSIRAQVRHGMMPSSIIYYEPCRVDCYSRKRSITLWAPNNVASQDASARAAMITMMMPKALPNASK